MHTCEQISTYPSIHSSDYVAVYCPKRRDAVPPPPWKAHFRRPVSRAHCKWQMRNLFCHLASAKKYSSVLFFSLPRTLWHSRRSAIQLLSVVRLRVCILSTQRLLLDMNFAELWHHQNSFSDFKVLCVCVCVWSFVYVNAFLLERTGWKHRHCDCNSLFHCLWHFWILCTVLSLCCWVLSCQSIVLIESQVTVSCYLRQLSRNNNKKKTASPWNISFEIWDKLVFRHLHKTYLVDK